MQMILPILQKRKLRLEAMEAGLETFDSTAMYLLAKSGFGRRY